MFQPKSLIAYFIVLLADLLLIILGEDQYRHITKPLLTVLLAIYVLYSKVKLPSSFLVFLLLALFFSSLGDDLLLFNGFFLQGLGSFLLAHIMYTTFFLKIRYSNPPVPFCKYPFILLNAAVEIAFIMFLLPYLGGYTIPVILYAIALFFTLQSALHAFHFQRQPAGWYCLAGAILFILSDSLIAVGKFYHPFPGINVLIMLTYGLGQCGLVVGGINYFKRITD